jgi:hypothetical protein
MLGEAQPIARLVKVVLDNFEVQRFIIDNKDVPGHE